MKHYLLAFLCLSSMAVMAEGPEQIVVNGKSRNMIVHVPEDTPPNAPLVISLHGFNQSAEYQRNTTAWDAVADTAKFVVVYPDAINSWWDVYGTEDLVFIEKIIDHMDNEFLIDRNRVYVTGFSLGAMMTYHCAEHLSDKVAAFGPVSGVRFDNREPAAKRKIPIIHTHGTADDVFKWEGDPGHQAGGYPYIPDYVKKWVEFDGLNPEPTVIDPYQNNASLTVWRDDDSSIEIALLAVKGCGHWYSEGTPYGQVSTSKEIWNFVKRYSLGDPDPVPPVLLGAEPENNSFDLPSASRTFSFTFDKDVDITRVNAALSGPGATTLLENTNEVNSPILTFSVPADVDLPDGDYQLNLNDVYDPEGGRERSYTFGYTYGIVEVGEKLNVDTIIAPSWDDMQATVGEGIPFGWKRVNSSRNGSNDTKTSGTPDTGGARLKYFLPGGDFNTGFYFSAREYDNCQFSYGNTSGYILRLDEGVYDFSFRSAYWNDNSENDATTFDVSVEKNNDSSKKYLSAVGVSSSANLKENTNQQVIGSAFHQYEFRLKSKDRCNLVFSIASGWNAVILGDILLTTHASSADRYKGGLLRTMIAAQDLYDRTADTEGVEIERDALKACMDKYAGFASTAPSAYNTAIEEVELAIATLQNAIIAGVSDIATDKCIVDVRDFAVDGREVRSGYKAPVIRRSVFSDGSVITEKIFR